MSLEPTHFLQSFASDGLTALMVAVSAMGYELFYVGVLGLITFGVSFRKGFLLIQMVLWVSLVTDLAKDFFGMPRPHDVDVNVKLPGEAYLGGFQKQSYGFPSGHVSSTTTFWGGASLLFRTTTVWALAAVIVLLMPVSRIYLGRHFPADVIGGLVLGLLAVAASYALVIRPGAPVRLLTTARVHLAANARTIVLLGGLVLLPPALVLLLPQIHPQRAGALFGLNVGLLLIGRRGFPDDAASLLRRAGRVIVAMALYAIAELAVRAATALSGLDADRVWIGFVTAAVPPGVMLWGAVRLGLKTGLYRSA